MSKLLARKLRIVKSEGGEHIALFDELRTTDHGPENPYPTPRRINCGTCNPRAWEYNPDMVTAYHQGRGTK